MKTAGLVQSSAAKAESANVLASTLAEASEKVQNVTALIAGISSKINLLALNATIEAARAGEAGRGFAVVANEVKMLAAQTDNSTQSIQQVMAEMRTASQDIITALGDIREAVASINNATTNVSSAVEEQVATTNEVARNMQMAADGTEVISGNLTRVTVAATDASSAGAQMLQSSQDLSRQSQILSDQVDHFLVTIRAA